MFKPLVTVLLSLFVFSFACEVTGPNGTYDLSSLANQEFTALEKPSAGGFVKEDANFVTMKFCVEEAPKCKEGHGACFYVGDKMALGLAKWIDSGITAREVKDDEGDFLRVTFTNAKMFFGEQPILNLQLRCGDSSRTPTYSARGYEYTIDHYSGALCGGLSGGWVFIIILLSVLTAYVVFGMVYAVKFQNKPIALSSLPGASIFSAIFNNAKNGVAFIISKITGKSSVSRDDYQSYGSADEV